METERASARVAENVRRVRQSLGWSLEELSERLAEVGHPLGLNVLSRLEQGKRRIDVDDLVALAEVLEAPTDYLVYDHADMGRVQELVWAWLNARADRIAAEGLEHQALEHLGNWVADHPDMGGIVADLLQSSVPPGQNDAALRDLERFIDRYPELPEQLLQPLAAEIDGAN